MEQRKTVSYHFYMKDHLGSNRVVASAAGVAEQVNHYYPYGSTFYGETTTDHRFKYCGRSALRDAFKATWRKKELDRMHGLNWYDSSARYDDHVLGRFHQIDPLAEKYYSWSPYAYCQGNPVRYVDNDGREIWIYYHDENGSLQSFQYSIGMTCNVKNSTAQTIVNNLNTMSDNPKGFEVVNAILLSDTKYGYKQANTKSEGGEGYFNPLTNITSIDDVGNTLTFAEETFHIYQRVNDQGGTTDVNEVDAKLFSAILNCEITDWNDFGYMNKLAGLPGSPYNDSMISLFENGFSPIHYQSAVNSFFSGSLTGNVYKNIPGYKHGDIKETPLIKRFLPANF